MSVSFFNPVFLRSTWRAEDAPAGCKIVAFAGRSNAGKSSVFNALCNGRFARVAGAPGRTQMVNLFQLPGGDVLADLPGYGYAKVARTAQKTWGAHLEKFLRSPKIVGLVLVVDCRRGILPLDEKLLLHFPPSLVLLNKSDKLNHRQQRTAKKETAEKLAEFFPAAAPVQLLLFSAAKKIGIEEARALIGQWLK